MPKFGIHTMVMSDAMNNLSGSGNAHITNAFNDIDDHYDMAMLGAIGPDLFFWAPDYEVVDLFYKFYKNLKKLKEIYDSVMEPINEITDEIKDRAEEAVSALADDTVDLIKGLINEIKETASLFKSTLVNGLFAGGVAGMEEIIDGINLIDQVEVPEAMYNFFQFFKPPIQNNKPIEDWYWFDALHYWKTGEFALNLIEAADTPKKRAYAFGYLSHIATDVSGHPFVNEIVGGPYRLNIQRHVVVENFMDASIYANHHEGANVNEMLLSYTGLENTNSLPSEIRDLLHTALRNTYDGVEHPNRLGGDGFLSKEQIEDTYEILHDVLKILRDTVVKRPEEPFSNVAEILADAFEDIFESPPSPPEPPSDSCSVTDVFSFGLTESSRDCYDEFFDNVEDWCEYMGELFEWTFDRLLELIDFLLTLLLSLPITVLLAILYALQLLLYEIYKAAHSYLALMGFVTPYPYEVETSHGRNLTTTYQGCSCKGKVVYTIFPKSRRPTDSHLICPKGPNEKPATIPDFHDFWCEISAEAFISDVPFNYDHLKSYSQALTPEQCRNIASDLKSMGNAIDFTTWMISKAADPTTSVEDKSILSTNWNLDADRGYGYKTWAGKVPDEDPYDVEDENYM